MNAPQTAIIYGQPPRDLVDLPTNATQCSPLIPRSTALETLAPQTTTTALIYAPPGTLERRYILALTLQALAPGATLTALARSDKGGNRIAAELEQFGCTVQAESRKHHRIVTTTRPAQLTGTDETIREGGPQQLNNLSTQPGIFSWDRLDPGSALLLKHLPEFTGRGADFGCGIGILSIAALRSNHITELTLIDIDRRAIDAASRNIADPRAQFLWADLRITPPPRDLDFILMNPPFHDTGIEDQTLGQTFITRAAEALNPGGTLHLTANRHLPYEALLREHFSRAELLAEADGFKIYRATK